ncbi:MAG: hypothetical protein WDN48_06095 [Pseudolabrys sp.]
MPFDPDYVREQFRARCIDTVDGMVWLLEDKGEAQGYLAAMVSKFFAAPVLVAVELAWFVKPARAGMGPRWSTILNPGRNGRAALDAVCR